MDGAGDSPTRALLELATVMPTPTLDPALPTIAVSQFESVDESISEDVQGSPTQVAVDQLTAPESPTVTPIPTSTLPPERHIELGWQYLQNEDHAGAMQEFQTVLRSNGLSDQQSAQTLFALGWSALEEGQNEIAVEALSRLISGAVTVSGEDQSRVEIEPDSDFALVADAYFLLARAYEERGQCTASIRAYEAYLGINPDMQAYIQPRIASCYSILEDQKSVEASLKLAAEGDAFPGYKLELNERLAQSLMDAGEYHEAISQYELIAELTKNPDVLGRANYQIGWAQILIGEIAAGYDRYLQAVEQYPEAFESYLALVDLLEADYTVDDYYRGVVDFYAGSYEPAVFVLQRYLDSDAAEHDDARLFLAWSFEELGNLEEALVQIDAHIAERSIEADRDETVGTAAVSRGWLERAKFLARAGNYEEAVISYLQYVELFPQGEQAPFAAWWAAALTEQLGQTDEAADLYEALADGYGDHQDASEALYRAGWLNWMVDEDEEAFRLWSRAATEYPEQQFGAASLVWLLKSLPEAELGKPEELASEVSGDTYYHLRAQDIVSDTLPYQAADEIELTSSPIEQFVAEVWLRDKAGLEPGTDIRSLSDVLMTDGRLVRGEKLWRLGLREEAKRELESLRADYDGDPIASYQLALYFRDLGLYRSSILAASSVLRNLGVHIFDAPPFLGKLIYPTYFSDLVLEEANKYGYDPLLQFALIRQESLFESFAQSHAAAMGLSQVIPDTGEYIAQNLEWPDYTLEDLYRPYVGIAFGAYYLDQQLDSFGGVASVALSAYNGGPGNASRWSSLNPDDIDEYLEIVDFNETREYIKRIYAGQAIYRYLYGSK
jgi:soluble lytic murein transglycosylase